MRHKIMVAAETPGINDSQRAFVRKCIRAALEAEGVDVPCEIDVLITDDAGIRAVNREMRQVDKPTDVLSFPMFDLKPGDKPSVAEAILRKRARSSPPSAQECTICCPRTRTIKYTNRPQTFCS